MKMTTRTLMIFLIVFSMVLAGCGNQPPATQAPVAAAPAAPTGIVAEGKLKPIHAANLTFQARGTVAEINVAIGEAVQQGQVLAQLANADLAAAQLAAARLEVTQAQQAYDQLLRTEGLSRAEAWSAYLQAQQARAQAERNWEALDVSDIEDRIDEAKSEVEDRNSDLKDAQDEFDKYKDLDQDNAKRKTAEDDLEKAQEDYNEAVRKLEATTRERDAVRAGLDAALGKEAEARHSYEQSLKGPNQEQLALLTARLDNAKAQVAGAEAALANYQIVAPFDGLVADVAIETGEQASPEQRALSVADTSAWLIETTDITELEVVDLAVGQNVSFTADALPDVTMTGSITEISQSSYTQSGDVLYTVRIRADDVDPRLKWGMTVEVVFSSPEN